MKQVPNPYMDENRRLALLSEQQKFALISRKMDGNPVPDPIVSKGMVYWLVTAALMYLIGWEFIGLVILLSVGYARVKQYRGSGELRAYNRSLKPLNKNSVEVKSRRGQEILQIGRQLNQLPRLERERVKTLWDELLVIDSHLADYETLEAHEDLTVRLNALQGVIFETQKQVALEIKKAEQEAEFKRKLDEVDAHHRYQLALNPVELEIAKHLRETLAADNAEQQKELTEEAVFIDSVVNEAKKDRPQW